MTRRGLMAFKSSQPRPHFSIVPVRKFSITTSAVLINSLKSSWPFSVLKFKVMQRLLRLVILNQRPTPSFMSPVLRSTSPRGCSTLMTSAPKSPICMPMVGPAMTVEASITRRPLSGGDLFSAMQCAQVRSGSGTAKSSGFRKIVVRLANRGNASLKASRRCQSRALSHMTTSPLRHVWV